MGYGVYFIHCIVLPSWYIIESMSVIEAGFNVDKYNNQIKFSVSHQFLTSDCTQNYLMSKNDAYSSKHVGLYKNFHKEKPSIREELYQYLSLFINTKLCYERNEPHG